jgi:hypothetical protein
VSEERARALLLVRAIETEDAAGEVLSHEERRAAGEAARRLVPAAGPGRSADGAAWWDWLAHRAGFLAERLAARQPLVARLLAATRWHGSVSWALPLAAFAGGLAVNAVAPDQRINIVAFPLIGMLLWNLAVYALLATAALRAHITRRSAPGGPLRRLVHRLGLSLSERAVALDTPLGRGLMRFVDDWRAWAAPLTAARASRLLHLGAALFAIGAVLGMYLRGIGLEYLAGWESTFVEPATLAQWLAIVLGPAAWLTGLPLPDAQRLAALRWPASPGENAALWIHLYAATALLVIVLPRLALALAARLRERALRRRMPWPLDGDSYARRLLGAAAPKPLTVAVLAYGYRPGGAARDALTEALLAVFGGEAQVGFAAPVPYGGEDEARPPAAGAVVVLFNLAATPEAENHGVLLDRLARLAPAGLRLLAVVDESPYRERLGTQSFAAERLRERRRAWQALLAAAQVDGVFLELAGAARDEGMSALRRAAGAA